MARGAAATRTILGTVTSVVTPGHTPTQILFQQDGFAGTLAATAIYSGAAIGDRILVNVTGRMMYAIGKAA